MQEEAELNSVEGVKDTVKESRPKRKSRWQRVCNLLKLVTTNTERLNDNQLKCSRCGGYRDPEDFEKGSKKASNLREGRSYNCKVCLMFDRTWKTVEEARAAGLSVADIKEGLMHEQKTPKLKIESLNKAIAALEFLDIGEG